MLRADQCLQTNYNYSRQESQITVNKSVVVFSHWGSVEGNERQIRDLPILLVN